METTNEKNLPRVQSAAPESPSTPIWISRIAAVFSIVLLAILLINYFQAKSSELLDNKQLAGLKTALVKTPTNEALKKQVRELDQQLREKHFRHTALAKSGAWLLFAGIAVFFISYKPVVTRKKLPKPVKLTTEQYAQEKHLTRIGICAMGTLSAVAAFALSLNAETNLQTAKASPDSAKRGNADAKASVASLPPFPTAEEWKKNWPRFRGPSGSNISAYTNVPSKWDVKTGENILWKTEVPISGPSSPVVWNDRIFLTGADETNREVYCFDSDGKLLWKKPVNPQRTNQEPPTVSGGYAPSTPCTDGRRVYAIFANGDIAAFDFSGTPVWSKNLGKPKNDYGHATSLEMYQNRVIVQLDQGSAKEKLSKILALDSATGTNVWESEPRPVPNSWATPIQINTGQRDLLIACGNPWVIAYDPSVGKEVWRAKALYGEVLPSPVYSSGVVYVAIEGEKLNAIPVNGTGDVTTNILWSADEGLPDIIGPLCDGERVYLVSSAGTITCYNAKTGKKVWDKELETNFKSSISVVGDKIYAIAENGTGFVFQAGNEYKEIARTDLGEETLSSPAYADGRFYIRGKKYLFCIAPKPSAAK